MKIYHLRLREVLSMSSNQIIYGGFSSTSKKPRSTESMQLTALIEARARDCGMSYGKYMSSLYMQKFKIKFPEWVTHTHGMSDGRKIVTGRAQHEEQIID